MKILLDMDGVIADFTPGACAKHGYEFSEETWPKGKYEIDDVLGLSAKDFWAPLDYEFWRTLPKTRFADKLMHNLYAMELDFAILTSPSLDPKCVMAKYEWLLEHYPNIVLKRKFLIGPAKDFCAAPNHVLVDDYWKNVVKFEEAGGMGILFPRIWNERWAEVDPVAWTMQVLKEYKGVDNET